MVDELEIWEIPEAKVIYMLAGWRQWADAGSISSGLPQYIITRTNAHQIGKINSDNYYLFQIPGTHDLVRPIITFEKGYPLTLDTQRNEIYYSGDSERGLVIFLGSEPHLRIEQYVRQFLQIAKRIGVKRIISFAGVYGELPFDKERMISSNYSLPVIKGELTNLAVNLSDYKGGASVGSFICRRAGEEGIEFVSFYAFVPTYDFSSLAKISSSIRIENDFMAWLGVMRRVIHMLKIDFDLSDLENKSKELLRVINEKVEEIDSITPQFGVRDYINKLSEGFSEKLFTPLDDVWEDELRRLLG